MMGAVFATFALRLGMDGAAPALFIGLAFVAGHDRGRPLGPHRRVSSRPTAGVNEIFAGLGLNFVAQGVILYLIFGPWKRPGIASMSGTAPFPTDLWLPQIQALRLSPVGLGLAVAAILFSAVALRYTRTGLRLRAVGGNAAASRLFGVRPGRYMLIAMLMAGGLAGLAGSLQVSGVYHRLIPAISSNYGYLALLVVMLAHYNVWVAPAVAFAFAGLNVGSIQLPMMLQIDSSLSGVIQGVLVLAALGIHAWQTRTPEAVPEPDVTGGS